MLILIKTPTITFSLDVQTTDDTELIYSKVAERTEYKRFQFNLLFAGEPLAKGPLSACGIRKEATIHMNVIKELKFNILYKDVEHLVSIPNNDGLNINHLHTQIKNSLSSSIPEISTHNIDLRKQVDTAALNKYSSLHQTLQNFETLELVLIEKPASKSSPKTEATPTVEETQFDQDALLNSFLETSISSDVEIVFCFDTTGSMSSIIAQVKVQVENTVSRLMRDIPNIRIGIMGMGDYCDSTNVLKTLDLTQDVSELVKFIKAVPYTTGGDAPEAYEWALRKAKSLSWSPHTSKAFVMIGDSEPHEPSYTDLRINWFEECDDLFDMGVKIYGIRALGECVFYDEIAERTGGICINFNKFLLITEMFLAICYREASKEKFSKYQSEINQNGVSAEMTEILTDLNKENFTVVSADKSDRESETPKPDDKPVETSTTSNGNSQISTPSAPAPKNMIVKQRGVPIKMRTSASWFDIKSDNLAPYYIYNVDTDSFSKNSNLPYTDSDESSSESSSSSDDHSPVKDLDPAILPTGTPLATPDSVPQDFTYLDGVISTQTLTKLFDTTSVVGKVLKQGVPKVVVVGDTKIGKTTFVNQMNRMPRVILFEEKLLMTFYDAQRISGYVVCYDPNNPNSFERTASYISEIKRRKADIPIFLVSLRTDLAIPEVLDSRSPTKLKSIYNIKGAFQSSTLDSEKETKYILGKIIQAVQPKKSCSIM